MILQTMKIFLNLLQIKDIKKIAGQMFKKADVVDLIFKPVK